MEANSLEILSSNNKRAGSIAVMALTPFEGAQEWAATPRVRKVRRAVPFVAWMTRIPVGSPAITKSNRSVEESARAPIWPTSSPARPAKQISWESVSSFCLLKRMADSIAAMLPLVSLAPRPCNLPSLLSAANGSIVMPLTPTVSRCVAKRMRGFERVEGKRATTLGRPGRTCRNETSAPAASNQLANSMAGGSLPAIDSSDALSGFTLGIRTKTVRSSIGLAFDGWGSFNEEPPFSPTATPMRREY